VRFVTAKPLVQRSSLGRKIKRLPTGNAFDVYDCICDAALRTDNQPFQVASLVRIRVANLHIFRDGKLEKVRFRPGPLDGPFDGAAVGDGDNSVAAALARGVRPGQQQSNCSRKYCDSAHPQQLFLMLGVRFGRGQVTEVIANDPVWD